MLFPGTTLFNKAFTYRKQQIPAADGRPARDVIHPNTVSRFYLAAALPATCLDLTVMTVACGLFWTLNTLTLNHAIPDLNRDIANIFVSYARMHIRTWILFVNPKHINYSLRSFESTCPDHPEKTSIVIERAKLYTHYFKNKVDQNHAALRPNKSLASRIKNHFEARICARIHYVGMIFTAAGESLRYSASFGFNLVKYGRSKKDDHVPYYLLANQYRLIVSLEKIWEGLFGVVFNETYKETHEMFPAPKTT